jgi:hypothetical protein
MNILVICSGLYVSLANALADGGRNTVWYYTCTGSAFPSYKETASGDKFEHIEKVYSFWDYVDKADMICTFDVGANDAIDYLRRTRPEKAIFGAGKGEQLENRRLAFKHTLEALDLPVIPYKVIKGFTALRKYLEANPKKVVKIDIFRGDFETLPCPDYLKVKQILDDRQPLFGQYAEDIQFIVEDMVDCVVESGFDGFVIDDLYIPFAYGYEVDKNLYLGKVTKDEAGIPDPLMETLDAFRPLFKKMNYRGALSTENRVVSADLSYFIDPCCRAPLPLGVLYSRYINNWPEFVESVGRGKPIDIECDYPYVGAYALGTPNARDNFTLVQIEKGHEDDFRFIMACQDQAGNYQAVKGHESVIVVVAAGKSPKDVVKQLKDKVQYVDAFNLETEPIKAIDEVFEKIEDGKTVGIDF